MRSSCKITVLFLGIALFFQNSQAGWLSRNTTSSTPGMIHYNLPTTGPLPQTYRVTIAITDSRNPDWILSQFISGQPRTVTEENQGHFTETWNGLDDNFMPLPPGTYGVKGIYMSAQKWDIDGKYHSVIPKFVTGAEAWLPTADSSKTPHVQGDPCCANFKDVAVAPNGIGVFYHGYLENAFNNYMVDLKKPIGYDQVIAKYNSGGAAGGISTCTDGETIWSFSTDGGAKFIYRADGKPFGAGQGAHRRNVTVTEGWIAAMTAYRDATSGKSYVYACERGRMQEVKLPRHINWIEDKTNMVNRILVLDGTTATRLAQLEVFKPQGIAIHNDNLYVLHQTPGNGFVVSSVALKAGLPQGSLHSLFTLPPDFACCGFAVDGQGAFYFSLPASNKVIKVSHKGQLLASFGRLETQKPGTYDKLSFMSPGKLAAWTAPDGTDRVIVVEQDGPNRISEWSSQGELLREWITPQTYANGGYVIDPKDGNFVYIQGQHDTLLRYRVDFEKGIWTADAVWFIPELTLSHPKMLYRGTTQYLVSQGGNSGGNSRKSVISVYRHEGERWILCAAILTPPGRRDKPGSIWSDRNGDGLVQEDECTPLPNPAQSGHIFRYHGDTVLDDFSILCMEQDGLNIWRLPVADFDQHGNPRYDGNGWQKLLTDPVFAAKQEGKATALFGANEVATSYNSDWASANGTVEDGFYVNARGGPNFDANFGAQIKISRYVPDGHGGYKIKWRTGRVAIQGLAQEGELYSTIFINPPINGIVGVVDNSRCGYILYTDDGLFVESMFPDQRAYDKKTLGMYALPGEFFAGRNYLNPVTGKIYLQFGKWTPFIYETCGWTATASPVRRLTDMDTTVTIEAGQIAAPPDIALRVRGGAGKANVANIHPATGGAPALDGTMTGWENCDPVIFGANTNQTVEVRCLYSPSTVYLRWHARLGRRFEPKDLFPVDRIFTHDRGADTVSFYFQGDPGSKPSRSPDGRPNDVRITFGLFMDGGKLRPVALGLYPKWFGTGRATSLSYNSPVGTVRFAHVGEVTGAELAGGVDADGKGFIITAALPASSLLATGTIPEGMKTLVDFDATFGGQYRFWWANADGSAGITTYDEPTEARLYPGAWAPAEFKPLGNSLLIRTWSANGPWGAEKEFHDGDQANKNAIQKYFDTTTYPLDSGISNTSGRVERHAWSLRQTEGSQEFIRLDKMGRLYFAASWIFSPEEMDLQAEFIMPISMNNATFNIGTQTVQIRNSKGVRKAIHLAKGWTPVSYRGYAFAYDLRFGLKLFGTPEQLWKLKLSPLSPQNRQEP